MDKNKEEREVQEQLPVEAQYQRPLLPIEVLTEFRNDTGSADLQLIVEGRDGRHYAVKTVDEGNGLIPAAELFCYELAYKVVIPTPSYNLVQLPDRKLGFGSVWEGGVVNGHKQINFVEFIQSVLAGKTKVTNLTTLLSRVYAFDLFVNNDDRHWQNYLWRTSFNNSIIGLAYDFSRASFARGYDGSEALSPDCNTQNTFKLALACGKIDKRESIECLERIRSVDIDSCREIIENIPREWMSIEDRNTFLLWWESPARDDRINRIITFINGSI